MKATTVIHGAVHTLALTLCIVIGALWGRGTASVNRVSNANCVERHGAHITGWIGNDGKAYWLETLEMSDADKRLLAKKLLEITQ